MNVDFLRIISYISHLFIICDLQNKLKCFYPNRFIPNGTNLFGFCWISVWNLNKFVRISDILIKPKLSQIQTKTFPFQTVGTKSPNDWNPNVQISDSWDQSPNDWNQNIRFGLFGPNCLKSERFGVDFRQLGFN